jgi:hypothetical protein
MNLVTPKAGAKPELLFKKQTSVQQTHLCLPSKSSSLAGDLGVTNFITLIGTISGTLCLLL